MTDDDICEVDFFVKSRLVKDTILLAKKKKETVVALSEFEFLSKIHPNEELMGDSTVNVH